MAAELCEVATSLAAAHLISACASRSRLSSKSSLLAFATLLCATCQYAFLWGGLGPAWLAGAQAVPISGAVLLAPLLLLGIAGLVVGSGTGLSQRSVAIGGVSGMCIAAIAWLHDVPHPHTALRMWLIACAHVLVCAAECRRAIPRLTFRDFIDSLCRALAYVAPAYPLLLLAASVTLMAASRLAGMSLERVHGIIDWGSINLPVWAVHHHCKLNCQHRLGSRGYSGGDHDRQSILPLAQTSIREKRISFFVLFGS